MSNKRNLVIEVTEYENPGDLNKDDRRLLEKAMEAGENAYSPYSGFKVGAAVRLNTGEIITGSNRENAAFPSGICAEHNAISSAGASFPDSKIVSIAVCAGRDGSYTAEPVSPCGNCRQVMVEEEYRNGQEIRIILYGRSRIYVIEGVKNILPLYFNASSLGH